MRAGFNGVTEWIDHRKTPQTGIEPLYTVQKVAELLSVDDVFVLDLIKARKITGLQLDEKTVRITGGSVKRYLTRIETERNREDR